MIAVSRLARSDYAGFNGNGGLYRVGRWHEQGHRIIYAAESEALAVEVLGHNTSLGEEYTEAMSSLHAPIVTSPEHLEQQLQNPTAEAIWARAVEVFGDETKARSWLTSSRAIFGGHSPAELVSSADPAQLRRVLEVLIRIDYGVFS